MLYCFKLLFSHINLHSIHHNDKAKTELSHIFFFLCISIQTLHAPLSWSTFTTSSLFWYDATSFAYKHLAFNSHSSPFKLCQVRWGQTHIFRFLQKYLIGFNPRLWLGHSRTFTALSISHSCCVFVVIVSYHKVCYQHTLLLGWYSASDEQFLITFKLDAWNRGSSDQGIMFLTVWVSFRCFFANSKCVFMCRMVWQL